MPQMGESVTEGTVLEWHKQEGEFVEEGETVVEVSTDKIDAEVPAPASGVITKLLVGPTTRSRSARRSPSSTRAPSRPETAPACVDRRRVASRGPGSLRADWRRRRGPGRRERPDDRAPAGGVTATVTASRGRAARRVVQISMPEMGESVTEGTVLEWHVAEGDAVAEGDTVVEVSTDKVDAEVPAPASGTITKLLVAARRRRAGRPGARRDDRWRRARGDGGAGRGRGPAAASAAPATDGGDGTASIARGAPRRGGERSRPGRRPGLGPGRQGDEGRRARGGERRAAARRRLRPRRRGTGRRGEAAARSRRRCSPRR